MNAFSISVAWTYKQTWAVLVQELKVEYMSGHRLAIL